MSLLNNNNNNATNTGSNNYSSIVDTNALDNNNNNNDKDNFKNANKPNSNHILVNTSDTYAFFRSDVSKNCTCTRCQCGSTAANLNPYNR